MGCFRSPPPCGGSLVLTASPRYAYSFVTKRVPEKSRYFRGARLAAKTMAASLLRKPARAVIRPAGANIARSPVSPRSTVAPRSQPRNPLRRGCGVAQRSKPQWGFEPHERASSAGWRPSFWPPSALPRNSETFSLPFWSQKGRHKNSMLFYWKGCRRVATLTKRKLNQTERKK